MCKSRFLIVASITFLVGSLFVCLINSQPQSSVQKEAEIPIQPQIIQETKPENPKTVDQNGEEIYWQGTSEGFNIRWTDKDIYVEKNGKTQKLFSNFAKTYYNKNFKFEQKYSEKLKRYVKTNELNSTCDISIDGQINSIVGEYLTLEVEEFFMCGIVQYATHLVVFDLKNSSWIKFMPDANNSDSYAIGRGIKITDLFDDKEVLSAFLDDAEVKESIDTVENNFKPKSTIELLKWFAKIKKTALKSDYSKNREAFSFGDITFITDSTLSERALSGFVINRIEDDKVVIKLALDSNSKRHGIEYLEIKLRIPESLKIKIEKANSKEEGFLEKDMIDNSTECYFEAKKKNE